MSCQIVHRCGRLCVHISRGSLPWSRHDRAVRKQAAMKIGLITDSVSHLSFDDALDVAQRLGLSSVEVATGNWSEAPHADLDALVSSREARSEFIGKISSRDLTLSALTANGNQLHPTSGKEQDQVVHDTIEVASALEVP